MKHFVLIERNPHAGYYSRYSSSEIIHDNEFRIAIEKLGGYVYNTAVGKIGDIVIFNGYTWISVHEVDSYEQGDAWAQKLENALYQEVV